MDASRRLGLYPGARHTRYFTQFLSAQYPYILSLEATQQCGTRRVSIPLAVGRLRAPAKSGVGTTNVRDRRVGAFCAGVQRRGHAGTEH